MALELAIYNRQTKTSASGKTYVGYVVAFQPGQRGAIPAAADRPPFYIRDQRGGTQWIRLEARSLADAKTEAVRQQHVLQAVARGVNVAVTPDEARDRLTTKVAAYLAEIEANKALATWRAYSRTTELFLASCKRLNVAEVKREDLLHFKTHLKKERLGSRSQYNHFLNIMTFFAWAKGSKDTMGIKDTDWPMKTERDPEAYSEEDIKKMLEAAAGTFRGLSRKDGRYKGEAKDDRLLINALLNSGLRDGELQHLTYGDIDPKHSLWRVRPKAGHALKTESSKRDVPVGDWLTAKVMERRKAESKQDSDLIFPNTQGRPDCQLLRVTQRIAELAGITGRVDNHKFRATAITKWLRAGNNVFDVATWAGHSSIATVQRYAAKLKLESKENRLKATQAFDQYATMGD